MDERTILDMLEKYCCFEPDLSDESYYNDIVNPLLNNIDETKCWDYAAGATKVALFFEGYPYVIKIPFYGEIGTEDGMFHEFKKAELNKEGAWDYLKAEKRIFKSAIEKGLDFLFAPVELIGYVDNHPIYQQPLVETFYNRDPAVEEEDKRVDNFLLKHNINFSCRPWLYVVKEFYSFDIVTQLLYFLDELECADFHSDNVGFINDRPVLLDYAGYNS